jgi:hypothetical protein
MDDINVIMTAIGSVGFPIVMCLYMITTFNKTLDKLNDQMLAVSTRLDTLLDRIYKDE